MKAAQVRLLTPADVEAVVAIQTACPEIAQWTAWDYDRVARGEMAGWVAEDEGKVAGFLVARRVAADFEILNFAVRPDARRHGIGAALLRAALDWGKTFQAEKAMLEVRASNDAALRFYERFGFQIAGRRTRYYTAPVEDALLLAAPVN
ncbi:MAG TPA: ribosomal protein S18-alanine N-acetyltransferase [Candidatus Limnocylindria bacterium]|nr:ribosomal protein S18-alanine N-acetyltransferase [Candidatus Limnocylindria bacterium]